MTIERPNQVWVADVIYIPIGTSILYLIAVIDWASRAVLAWRLSNTMDSSFCVDALEEALARFGQPEIFNTDQGSQFTGIGRAGGGGDPDLHGWPRALDGQDVHRRPWRSLKYEDVYLKGRNNRLPRSQTACEDVTSPSAAQTALEKSVSLLRTGAARHPWAPAARSGKAAMDCHLGRWASNDWTSHSFSASVNPLGRLDKYK